LARPAGPADALVGDVGAVAPVGPFCPFVSDSFLNLQPSAAQDHRERMERTVNRIDEIAMEARPDPLEQARLGRELRELDTVWRGNLLLMRNADDFQTRELHHFTEAHIRHLGGSLAEVEGLASWQADVLEAIGDPRRSMPPPPVDPASEKALHLRGVLDSVRLGGSHTLTLDLALEGRTAESPVVQEELQELERDHRALIQMGQGYGGFDAAGKQLFLDQVDKIGERWEVFLARFRLMGEPGPGYLGDAAGLLKRLGLNSSLAVALLGEAHARMRVEAEQLT